jgi:hypothetical protein
MFDILIPTTNRAGMLKKCIESLGGRYVGKIFVGYEKPDDIAGLEDNKDITCFILGAKGCGDAKQKIYEKWSQMSDAKYFCVSDDDCVVSPRICNTLYENFSCDSRIAAMATVWGEFGVNLQKLVYPIHDVNCSDTFCIYDREAFEKATGYDERMFVHEGFDLQTRLKIMGFRVCVDKTCIMEHAYYSNAKSGTGAQTYNEKEDFCGHLLMRKYRDLLSADGTLSSSGRIRYTVNWETLEKYQKKYKAGEILLDKYVGIMEKINK